MTAQPPERPPEGEFNRDALNRSLEAAIVEAERRGYISMEESKRRIQELFASWKK